jgi:excisionase family DNA binding protein
MGQVGRPREQAPPGYVTVQEAAELLGVSYQAIHKRMQRGTLPFEKGLKPSGGHRLYIPRASVEEVLTRNSEPQHLSDYLDAHVGELAEHLDAMSARLVNIDRNVERIALNILANSERQEQIGVLQEEASALQEQLKAEQAIREQEVSALQEQLKAEQAAREAAETELDNLRNLSPHSED